MPFVDDPNKLTDDSVAGANPLGAGAAPQASGGDTGGDQQAASSGPATIQSGQSVDQIQSQGGTTNKKAPKASSGMFTNIQKYVDKNRPQAQKMAGAATEDFSKKAADIRNAVESQQANQNQLLQSNQQNMNTAKEQAQASVNQIMGQTPQENTQAASADDFQSMMKGNVKGYENVQDLNLAEQQNRMGALSQLAKGTATEQGRRNLLSETFKKRGDYSRGMSGLDQLITSGDKAARESMIGTQDTAKQLGSDINTISQDQRDAVTAQKGLKDSFGKDITGLISGEHGALSGIDTAVGTEKGILEKKLQDMKDQFGSSFGADGDNKLPQWMLDSLGLESGMDLYGVDPTSYMDNLSSISNAQAMTPEQAKKIAALSQLSGVTSTYGGVDEEQAAAGFDPKKAVDLEGFNSAVQAAKTDWEGSRLEDKQKVNEYYAQQQAAESDLEKFLAKHDPYGELEGDGGGGIWGGSDIRYDKDLMKQYEDLKNKAETADWNRRSLLDDIDGSSLTGPIGSLQTGNAGGYKQSTIDELLARQAAFKKLGIEE